MREREGWGCNGDSALVLISCWDGRWALGPHLLFQEVCQLCHLAWAALPAALLGGWWHVHLSCGWRVLAGLQDLCNGHNALQAPVTPELPRGCPGWTLAGQGWVTFSQDRGIACPWGRKITSLLGQVDHVPLKQMDHIPLG